MADRVPTPMRGHVMAQLDVGRVGSCRSPSAPGADGFHEWTGPKDARKPLWFHRADRELLFFAGLYESWQPSPETWQRTFPLIITEANDLMRAIHDRMPVLLNADDVEEWLFQGNAADAVRRQLVPAPNEYLVATAASPRVNSVKNDDPACLVGPDE